MTKKTNLPVNPTELLKKQLADANKRVGQSDAKRIKLNVAGFTDPTGAVGNALEVVVIDYTLTHSYFEDEYDADNIVPPICHSNSRVFEELAPVEGCPQPQADRCSICPMNRFKSHPNGRAKACRNYRLLGVVPANNIAAAPIWTVSVSPTATKVWDDYNRELMSMNLTPMFVKTKIEFEIIKTYAKPKFSLIEALSKEETSDAIARLDEAREIIDLLPDWSEEAA
jgi:hypothetical protein